LGIESAKLDLVAAWKDAGIFSARESAALGWAESLTAVAIQGASDEAYESLRVHFTETEAVFLSVAISTINSWNRLDVALRFSPPFPHTPAKT